MTVSLVIAGSDAGRWGCIWVASDAFARGERNVAQWAMGKVGNVRRAPGALPDEVGTTY
jgi:hypothetical protein